MKSTLYTSLFAGFSAAKAAVVPRAQQILTSPALHTVKVPGHNSAYYTQIDLDQPKAYAYAKEVMSMNALAADAQEGIGAFLGKRAPCWTGK